MWILLSMFRCVNIMQSARPVAPRVLWKKILITIEKTKKGKKWTLCSNVLQVSQSSSACRRKRSESKLLCLQVGMWEYLKYRKWPIYLLSDHDFLMSHVVSISAQELELVEHDLDKLTGRATTTPRSSHVLARSRILITADNALVGATSHVYSLLSTDYFRLGNIRSVRFGSVQPPCNAEKTWRAVCWPVFLRIACFVTH